MMNHFNNFILGDCMQIMPTIDSNYFDLVLTDIPYNHVNRNNQGLRNLNKGKADILTFDIESFITELYRITRGSFYIFCAWSQISEILTLFDNLKLSTRLCIWEKTNPSPMNGQHLWLSGIESCIYAKKRGAVFNEHCKNPVWRYPSARNKIHPTTKPLSLLQYLIRTSSNKHDLIFDPCAGSASTLKAAKLEHRNYFGIELDTEFFKLANESLQ